MGPTAAPGMQVAAFASGLAHPRWLYVLPNGDVLVAETNAPPKPEDGKGIKAWVMGLVMQRAGAATASADRTSLPTAFAHGMFVGQHGSWNRNPHSGYKVIFVPFQGAQPAGMPVDVLAGFLSAEGKAYCRPVGVALDKQGALLVADDVGNVVWRVTAKY